MADEGGSGDGRNAVLFIVYILLFLVAVWFLTGGPKRASVSSIFLSSPSPFGTSSFIALPTVSYDTPGVTAQGDYSAGYGNSANPLTDQEKQTFGLTSLPTSPYAGMVRLQSGSGSYAQSAADEYVVVQYASGGSNRIPISGWRLQSAITKRTVYIYQGTEVFAPQLAPPASTIYLGPGDSAIITSGRSPVGASFKANKCTGYLAQFQRFTPDLYQSCPLPLDEARAMNLGNSPQDADCIDYMKNVSQCRIATDLPSSLSDSCRYFIQNTLTYQGCLNRHIHDTDFLSQEWRIYLNSDEKLWRADREVLTLLDQDGKLVDSIVF
jgi:hypothetical protein